MQTLHITLKKDQSLFFTSDLHFNHDNIIKFCKRPFANSKEMNKVLINNWNRIVKNDDIVFILGDFNWFPSRHDNKKLISNLNGEIYMILGNHDKKESFELLADNPKFHLLDDIVHLYVHADGLPFKNMSFCLSHYPLATWSNSWWTCNLYGHIHSKNIKKSFEFVEELLLNKNQLDIGIDAHNYFPVSVWDVVKEIDKRGFKWPKNQYNFNYKISTGKLIKIILRRWYNYIRSFNSFLIKH